MDDVFLLATIVRQGSAAGSVCLPAGTMSPVTAARAIFEGVTRSELVTFLRHHRLCVQTSVSASGAPQAAMVGFGVTDDLEIVFDTLDTTRKVENLRRDPRVALVVGCGPAEQTVQIEGHADEPAGSDLERLKAAYFVAHPDGVDRQRWKGITYVRVRTTWARFSDFGHPGGPRVVELRF